MLQVLSLSHIVTWKAAATKCCKKAGAEAVRQSAMLSRAQGIPAQHFQSTYAGSYGPIGWCRLAGAVGKKPLDELWLCHLYIFRVRVTTSFHMFSVAGAGV